MITSIAFITKQNSVSLYLISVKANKSQIIPKIINILIVKLCSYANWSETKQFSLIDCYKFGIKIVSKQRVYL